MPPQLRDYQSEGVDAIFHQWEAVVSTLGVCATGGGKTAIAAEVIRRVQPKRAIFICHREELVFQACATIRRFAGLECGIEMADNYVNDSLFGQIPVVVATVQTLNAKWGDRTRMSRFKPEDFGVLVADEVHHGVSKSWRNVINYFSQNPDLRVLGITASADRADEEALGQICKTVAFDLEILDLIHRGWLVPVDQQFVNIGGLDFSHMRTTAGDLNGADLNAVMEAESNLQGVAGASVDIIGKRRAIVFTASVKQAEVIANIFNRHRPGMSDWVCGMTNKDSRREMLARFQRGEIQVVCNCGVLTEGFDDPGVEVIVMARPTKSRALYAQMAGRSTRPLPGVVDGLNTDDERKAAIAASAKPNCLLVDFVGNSGKHKLMSCIAEGQLVLTDKGLIPIENVTSAMMVWDGLTFVPNTGIVSGGEQTVITYAGLTATEDHEVWTKEGWKTFGECASKQISISVTGHGRQTVREVDGNFRGGISSDEAWPCEAIPHDAVRVWGDIVEGLLMPYGWGGGMSEVCMESMCSAVACEAMRWREDAVHESQLLRVCKLRWARHSVPVCEAEGHGAVDYAQPWSAAGFVNRPNQQQRSLRGWQLTLGECGTSNKQQQAHHSRSRDARIPNRLPRFQNIRWALDEIAEAREVMGRHSTTPPWSRPLQRTARVFDITNAGPRHRFTVQGVLVSNCADILGGKVSDDALERAVKRAQKLGKPVRMSQVLDEEEDKVRTEAEERCQREEARKAKLVAKVEFTRKSINPFDVFEIEPVRERGWDNGKTLSEKQRSLLLKQGIDPSAMPYGQAKAVLNTLFDRWSKKLATLRQCELLKKHGYQTKDMTMDNASRIITALKNNGWKRPSQEPEPVMAEEPSVPF